MLLGTDLKLDCPAATTTPTRTGLARWWHHGRRWNPFVFPWSGLQRMTGIVSSDAGTTSVRGRLDGRCFSPETPVHRPTNEGLADLADHRGEPVCICLPRSQTLVRHFRVPAQSDAEIDAMLPHLLAAELPMSLDHFSWVWAALPTRDTDLTLVAVHIARNDRLAEFLSPLPVADLNLVGLIPEAWSWTHVLGQVDDQAGAATTARSILIRSDNTPLLVVAQAGQLLFDLTLPDSACPAEEVAPGTCPPNWDGPEFSEARSTFAELLGFPLPQPEVWPDALLAEGKFKAEKFCFAASVAAAGLGHDRLLMPTAWRQRSRRRTALGTLAGLGRLAALVAAIWLAFAVYETGRMRHYLAALEHDLASESGRVEILERERAAIRENTRERAGSTEILRVMDSLRRHVKAPIYLAHLNYVQGSGVTLRGGAPASGHVLEMTDQLATDPLWQGLRVTQLRSEKVRGTERTQFVIEGQLNP